MVSWRSLLLSEVELNPIFCCFWTIFNCYSLSPPFFSLLQSFLIILSHIPILLGSSDELGDLVSIGLELFDDDLESEILIEVLRCVISISQQLGKTASAVFYESLVSTPVISSEEILPCVSKILATGYSSSAAMLHISDTGADIAWEKKMADHKNLRKFSIDMLLSLHALCEKAGTWGRVLNVIESFLKFVVPRKIIRNFDDKILSSINASTLVQATSQISQVMFETAMDVLLFLTYLVNISGQVFLFYFIIFVVSNSSFRTNKFFW
jgi:hypothetical protein